MARTVTIQLVRDRYSTLIGIDPASVIDDDATAFLQYVNRNLRKIWSRGEWTFATRSIPSLPDSNRFVDLSSNTEISEVLRVNDAFPYTSNTAVILDHIPVRDSVKDGVYIPDSSEATAIAVTSITRVTTTATVTTTAAHNYATNDFVVIAGAVETDYNGTFEITVLTTTTFTYTVAGSPTTPATGTITSTKATAFLFSRIRESVFTLLTETVDFELQDYLAHACAADWFRAEGQSGKAKLTEDEANVLLDDELYRLEKDQKHQPPTIIGQRKIGVK